MSAVSNLWAETAMLCTVPVPVVELLSLAQYPQVG